MGEGIQELTFSNFIKQYAAESSDEEKDALLAEGISLEPLAYVSGCEALRHSGWVAEAIVQPVFVTSGTDKTICTEHGTFNFVNIPQKDYKAGVVMRECCGRQIPMAKPLKAIVDYIASWRTNKYFPNHWREQGAVHFIEEDIGELFEYDALTMADFDELGGNYPECPTVSEFLTLLCKELGLK